jgi:crossover junction endodeoxyribonuclease RuvC
MNAYIGLDPGSASGAWAIIGSEQTYIGCGDIKSHDGRIDVVFLHQILLNAKKMFDEIYIAVELVGVRPGQGIASSGKFMRAAGAIEATAALTGAPMILVTPQRWKKHHGLIGTEKKASLELARQRWPDAPLKLIKHHGRADALLMALWLKDQVK